LLPTTYKTLSDILVSRLTPNVDELIGYHQCGFQNNRSTNNQIFCIHQILDKKWKYNGTVHQLFIDCDKVYYSMRREILYNIINETYSIVCIGKNLSDEFPIQNGLKQGDALSPLLFNFALKYAIRKV
jgi:hypothetical protein